MKIYFGSKLIQETYLEAGLLEENSAVVETYRDVSTLRRKYFGRNFSKICRENAKYFVGYSIAKVSSFAITSSLKLPRKSKCNKNLSERPLFFTSQLILLVRRPSCNNLETVGTVPT